ATVAGAAVDGGELADHVAVADLQAHRLAAEFLVLRLAADRGVAVDVVVAADAGRPEHAAVRADARARADLDAGADDREGTDAGAFADDRGQVDGRGGVD